MKSIIMLTVTFLLSILLLSLHIAKVIVLRFGAGGLENLVGIAHPRRPFERDTCC